MEDGRYMLSLVVTAHPEYMASAKRPFQKLIKPDSLIKASAVMLPQ